MGRYIENNPPRPWSSKAKPPKIKNLRTFCQLHRQLGDKTLKYLQEPRRNYRGVPWDVYTELLSRNADGLFVCNTEARIRFAEVALDQLRRFDIANRGPHFFVTICPDRYVSNIARAAEVSVESLQAFVREALHGFDFLGMVEAALYVKSNKLRRVGYSLADQVSWHTHLIVWNTSHSAIEAALEPVAAKHVNLHGRSPIHITEIAQPADDDSEINRSSAVEAFLLYMLKGQVKEYWIDPAPPGAHDPETGEVISTVQQKRIMRTGNIVRMCCVLEERRLPDLLFGGGLGTSLARAIEHEAMRPFCRWAAVFNRDAELKGISHTVPYPEVKKNHDLGLRLARELPGVLNRKT